MVVPGRVIDRENADRPKRLRRRLGAHSSTRTEGYAPAVKWPGMVKIRKAYLYRWVCSPTQLSGLRLGVCKELFTFQRQAAFRYDVSEAGNEELHIIALLLASARYE